MEVDLNQLPIPDWDLECPNCRYPLRGLPEHRCPECGTPFDVGEIVRSWSRLRPPRISGDTRPLPALGIHCPGCNRPLDGLAGRNCPGCGREISAQSLRPRSEWFRLESSDVPLAAIEVRLAGEQVPFLRMRPASLRDLYFGSTVIGTPLMIPSEFELEVLSLVAELREELRIAASGPRKETACASCGEAIPDNFEVCWNCGVPKPGK